MNVKYFSIQRVFSAKRMLAAALILGSVLVGTPLLATQNDQANAALQATAQTQTTTAGRSSEVLEVSSSRINGRIDWDVDYPSQLAPQPVHAVGRTDNVAVSATAGCVNAANCALKPVQP